MRRMNQGPGIGVPNRVRKATAVLIAALAVGAGCSAKDGRVPVYPVSGKVTIGGEVPAGALIILYPTAKGGETELRPSGKVDSEGKFTLTTYDADDGAPAGEYAATIQWNKLVKKGNDYGAGPNAVPKAYGDGASSPWKVKVATGPNQLEALDIAVK